MNKTDVIQQLQDAINAPSSTEVYDATSALDYALDLVDRLTRIEPLEYQDFQKDALHFPEDIKNPLPLRRYGVLFVVLDKSDEHYYVTREDGCIFRTLSEKMALDTWECYVYKYYPETINKT
jgi:hypothetical protein